MVAANVFAIVLVLAQGFGHFVAFALLESNMQDRALCCVVVSGGVGIAFIVVLTFVVGKARAQLPLLDRERTSMRESPVHFLCGWHVQ
jgi:hypothetical protein